MFPGFEVLRSEAEGVQFAGVTGGSGPAIVLLHGYPQTHVAWRHVAPSLAADFSVLVPDLPGYGASRAVQDGRRWTKRRAAGAVASLMSALGHDRFVVVGHDRGARVGYRLALDHPDRVAGFASLTVVPTQEVWARVDKSFAMSAFHWFMLAQPFDLPERLLASDPDAFLDRTLTKMAGDLRAIDPEALDAYRAAFRDPAVRHAMCEDYRAAANEDAIQDTEDFAAGRKFACPVLVLWPERGGARTETPADVWRRWANDVSGRAIAGGHLQPERSPADVLAELKLFLSRIRIHEGMKQWTRLGAT